MHARMVVGVMPYPREFCTLPNFVRELNNRHMRSHGKIGDGEQSSVSCSPLPGTPWQMRETNCRGGWNRVGESSFLMYFVCIFPAEPLSQEQI